MLERLPKWMQNKWVLAGLSFLLSSLVCILIYFLILRGILASVLAGHGLSAYEDGRYETAVAKYAAALNLAKGDEQFYLNYAKALIAIRDFETAAELLEEGIDRHSGSAELYLCRVEALVKEGRIGDAADFLDNIKNSYINKEIQKQRPGDISYTPTQGSYDSSQKVTMQVRDDETIYYTLNGSAPTLSSAVYREPITVASSMTINAIAVSEDNMVSPRLEISYTINNDDETVIFEDSKIEKMVRATLNKPNGKLFAAQLANVTELHNADISGNVRSLKDLEFMPNLTALTLDGEMLINDYAPLAGLTELTYLSLADCALSNSELPYINACTKLVYLNLEHNDLASLAGLESLEKLEFLNAANNSLTNLTTVGQFTALSELNLSYNKIRNLSPLSSLENLQILRISGNNSTELGLEPLAELTELIQLELSETMPADLTTLKDLPNLISINVSDCDLNTLSDFNDYRRLTVITAEGNEIESLSAFTKTVEELYLRDNPLTDLTPLKRQEKLTFLDLSETDVSDITPLAALPALQTLYITETGITDATALSGCPTLLLLFCDEDCVTTGLPATVTIERD